MIVEQAAIKSRLDELRLSYDGFTKQLTRPGLSAERAERLHSDLEMLREEIATLEKLQQLGRVEPDRARVEAAVQERLEVVQERLLEEMRSVGLEAEAAGAISGEARGLLWALGRDRLTLAMQDMSQNVPGRDPGRTDRAIPNILLHALQEAPDAESRASAAYELGRLQLVEAIPSLVRAVEDRDSFVVDVALQALGYYPDEALREAQVSPTLIERVARARQRP
ncbi:MAG: HEAT repeat domain-containing protein [Chloroflexota bacterium]|nr:HEAT repeat domain-containing protein [Chloroflexota bacterium]MDQ5864307.1 HEAT repeat domain-containing protein [Chloroflexota bacterium]